MTGTLSCPRCGRVLAAGQRCACGPVGAGSPSEDGAAGPRLGELLIRAGHTTRKHLVEAVIRQREGDSRPLGEILLEQGAVDAEALIEALGAQVDLRRKSRPIASAPPPERTDWEDAATVYGLPSPAMREAARRAEVEEDELDGAETVYGLPPRRAEIEEDPLDGAETVYGLPPAQLRAAARGEPTHDEDPLDDAETVFAEPSVAELTPLSPLDASAPTEASTGSDETLLAAPAGSEDATLVPASTPTSEDATLVPTSSQPREDDTLPAAPTGSEDATLVPRSTPPPPAREREPSAPALPQRAPHDVTEGSISTLAESTDGIGSGAPLPTPPIPVARTTSRIERKDRTQDRYEIGQRIARGGMGEILVVKDLQLHRQVAMKRIRPEYKGHPQRLRRFISEAQVTGQLSHPGIVPVYDLGVLDDDTVYFTMKRVTGDSLRTVLSKIEIGNPDYVARYGLVERLGLFTQICNAVAFAHSNGVIHRDLKPDNIMIGEFGEVLVMDWGVAKVRDELGMTQVVVDREEKTMYGSVFGTPRYMAPEQAQGRIDQIDERSDIYSLGAILYQLLTLTPPFSEGDQSTLHVLERVKTSDFVPPGEGRTHPAVPHELQAVVMKAMAGPKEARYPSVGALAGDIHAYLAGRALQAARYTAAQLIWKWATRHQAKLGVATALFLAVVGLVLMPLLTSRFAARRSASRVQELLGQASALAQAGELERAREFYGRVLELDARNFEALDARVKLERRIDTLRSAARVRADAQRAEAEAQRLARARELARQQGERDREHNERLKALFDQVAQLEQAGTVERLREAQDYCDRVLGLDPENYQALATKTRIGTTIEQRVAEARRAKGATRVTAGRAWLTRVGAHLERARTQAEATLEAVRIGDRAAAAATQADRVKTLRAAAEQLSKARDELERAQRHLSVEALREPLAELNLLGYLIAEGLGQPELAAHYRGRVETHDVDGRQRTRLAPRGQLVLTLPRDGWVELHRIWRDSEGRCVWVEAGRWPAAVRVACVLDAGDYVAEIIPADAAHPALRVPFQIGRDLTTTLEPTLPRRDAVPPDMVYIPGGIVPLGGDPAAFQSLPAGAWYVPPFLIGRHEVTFGRYAEYLTALSRDGLAFERAVPRDRGRPLFAWLSGRLVMEAYLEPTMPVCGISLAQAEGFLSWLRKTTGRAYRLPTELEWEKAARAGDRRIYPWGDRFEPGAAVVAQPGQRAVRRPVGHAPRDVSLYGVHDLAGSVAEWTATRHHGMVVCRGGSFQTLPNMARAAKRNYFGNQSAVRYIGLRLALDAPRD